MGTVSCQLERMREVSAPPALIAPPSYLEAEQEGAVIRLLIEEGISSYRFRGD